MSAIPFVRLAGDPFGVGRGHGAARSAALRAFLDDGLARLNAVLPAPVTRESLRPTIAAYRDTVAAATPALASEVDGLAAGAGIDRDEAMLLQLRREILGYRRIPVTGDCTTYARVGAAGPVLAQTVDLNGNLDDQLAVLHVTPSGTARRTLVLSFAGLLGYLGLNSDGLAIGLNLVLGGRWGPGVPPYLAIRHLLDTATGVDEALALLATLPLASSRCLVLCDRTGCAYVEVCGDQRRVVRSTAEPNDRLASFADVVHTNHFLHPDLASGDELNVFARNSSRRRLEAGRAALAALAPDATAAAHFRVLSAEPIRVPDIGDIRLERTVAAVVLEPARGAMHVRRGDPAATPTETFTLDGG
jgi:isopenicillin-N N-acyltransferase-like protein